MDDIGSLVNHSLATPLRVVGKEQQCLIRGLLEAQSHLEGVEVIQGIL